jgi:hypothetical protein
MSIMKSTASSEATFSLQLSTSVMCARAVAAFKVVLGSFDCLPSCTIDPIISFSIFLASPESPSVAARGLKPPVLIELRF